MKRTRKDDSDDDYDDDDHDDQDDQRRHAAPGPPPRRIDRSREEQVGDYVRGNGTGFPSLYESAQVNNPRAAQCTQHLPRAPRHTIVDDVQRIREDDNDNNDHYYHDDQRRDRRSDHSSGRTKRALEEQVGANIRRNGTDLQTRNELAQYNNRQSQYELAQHNNPRAAKRTQDLSSAPRHTIAYDVPFRPSPSPEGRRNVRIYFHAWQARKRDDSRTGESAILDGNAKFADLWLVSRVLEGRACDKVLASQGSRRVPMRIFPDLTSLNRLEVLCIRIN